MLVETRLRPQPTSRRYWLVQLLALMTAATITKTTTTTTTTTTTKETGKCATSCHCYQHEQSAAAIYSIICVRAGLRAIPHLLDFYPQIFNLSGNELAYVPNDAFRNAYSARLEIVDLSANRVKALGRNAFANLANLLEIDLSRNQLRTIRASVFRRNRFLNTIRLSGNPIKELGENAFPLSVYLKTLDLQGCQLRRIHRYAFFSTPLLETLNLKDNALKSPPTKVLRLTRLRTLQLDGNPLKCDAALWRVLEWMRNRRVASVADDDSAATAARSQSQSQQQSLSLPCVFGETQNAVFWDTMEVGDGGDRSRRRRDKRAITDEAGNTGYNRRRNAYAARRSKNLDKSKPKPRALSTSRVQQRNDDDGGGGGGGGNKSEDIDADGNFYWGDCIQHYEYSPTRFLENRYKPKPVPAVAVAATAATAAAVIVTAPTRPTTSRFVYDNVKMARNYVERPRPSRNVFLSKFHKNVDALDSSITTTAATAATAQLPPLARPQLASRVDDENCQQANTMAEHPRSRPRPDSTQDDDHQHHHHLYDDGNGDGDEDDNEGDDDDDSNFVQRNRGIILGAEIVLIVILLMILYQLWKENRKRCDDTAAADLAAISIALNGSVGAGGGGVQLKSYDTRISGYKRYSLSDEEYSNIRNTTTPGVVDGDGDLDEAKCDSESGYLSYHRYNSVEGENAAAVMAAAAAAATTSNNDYGSIASYHHLHRHRHHHHQHQHQHQHHYGAPACGGKEEDDSDRDCDRDHISNIRKNRRNSTGDGRDRDRHDDAGKAWRTIPRRTSRREPTHTYASVQTRARIV